MASEVIPVLTVVFTLFSHAGSPKVSTHAFCHALFTKVFLGPRVNLTIAILLFALMTSRCGR